MAADGWSLGAVSIELGAAADAASGAVRSSLNSVLAWWQDARTQASRLTVFPATVPSGTVMTLPAGAQVELVELADSGPIHRLTERPMTVLDEGITQVAVRPSVASLSATVGAGPSAAAVEHSDQVFSVPGLPVTFRYPAAWGPPQSENATHRVRGPAGRSGRPIEIIIHVENKRDHPGSSAWRQVIRAQDQLTLQNGIMVVMDSATLNGQPVPYVLAGFPMAMGTFNVLQFVVDHEPHYLWICFSGPSDAWEEATSVLTTIRDSIRFVAEAKQ